MYGQTQYTFEVQAHTYSNRDSQLANGACCRPRGRCQDCRNIFQFCLTATDAPLMGSDGELNCTLGRYQFQRDSDRIEFDIGPEIVPGENVPNPMTFNTATGPWPVSVCMPREEYTS